MQQVHIPNSYRLTESRVWVRCVVLSFVLGTTLLILNAGIAHIGHAQGSSSGEIWLEGLPVPDLGPQPGLDARYTVLFPTPASNAVISSAAEADAHDNAAGPSHARFSRDITDTSDGSTANAHSRLVVVPDLHGDAQQALAALLLAGLISPNASAAAAETGAGATARRASWGWEWQWTGGDAVLVQLGDVVDRGPDSLALLGLLERLRAQARAAGGDVVSLLGNHELMNIHHDFRYVSRLELLDLAAAGGLPPLWPGARKEHPHTDTAANSSSSAATEAAAAEGRARIHRAVHAVGRRKEGAEEEAEEERSLRAESEDLAGRSADRELLHSTARSSSSSSSSSSSGGGGGDDGGGDDLALTALTKRPHHHPQHQGAVAADGWQWWLDRRRRRRKMLALRDHASDGMVSEDADWPECRGGCGDGRAGVDEDRKRRLEVSASDGDEHNRSSRRLSATDQQGQQQQQVMDGLDLWRGALAADEPLGVLVRQRPLAALVDAGGCRFLAVHAGAFPWMLRAVELLVVGDAGGGGGGSDRQLLQPEQYVAAWNVAVAAALVGCEGRECGRRRDGAGGQPDDPYESSRLALADLLLGGDGAVWSRRYISGPPRQVCFEVAAVARQLGVQRIVVGHTVQHGGRVSSKCGGQLLMADVGLSRAIAGEMAVLQCTAGNLDVLYGAGRVERLK